MDFTSLFDFNKFAPSGVGSSNTGVGIGPSTVQFNPQNYSAPQSTPLPATPQLSAPAKPQYNNEIIPKANAYMDVLTPEDKKRLKQAMDQGYSQEEAFNLLYEFKQQQGDTQMKAEEAPAPQEGSGFLDNPINYLGESIGNTVGGAIAEIPEVAAGVLSTANELGGRIRNFGTFTDEDRAISDKINNAGKSAGNFVKKYGAYDPESTGAKVGEFGTDIAATIVGPNKYVKAAKDATNFVKGATYGTNLVARGLVDANKWTAATEGRTATPWEAVAFGALSGAGDAVAGAASKLMSTGLQNKVVGEVDDAFTKLTGEAFDPKRAGKWLLDNGITGSYGTQVGKLTATVPMYEKAANKVLADAGDEVFSTPLTKKLQKALVEKLSSYGKFSKGGKFTPTAGNEELAQKYLEFAGKKGLTYQEINGARSILGDKIFTKSSEFKEASSLEGWKTVWKEASNFLDDAVPNFRTLNKNIQVGRTMLEAAKSKAIADTTSAIVKLAIGGGGIGGAAVIGGLGGKYFGLDTQKGAELGVGIALGAGAAKYLMGIPAFRTSIASVFNKMSQEGRKGIKEATRLKSLSGELRGIISKFMDTPIVAPVVGKTVRGTLNNIVTSPKTE